MKQREDCSFSIRGARHEASQEENQDAVYVRKKGRLQAVCLADGVSTCSRSARGAKLSTQRMAEVLLSSSSYLREAETKEVIEFLTDEVLYQLRILAKEEGRKPEDYSSTLASVLFNRNDDSLVLFNLGDCMIMGLKNDQIEILCQPDESLDGTCTTTTEEAGKRVSLRRMERGSLQAVLLLSDGAWRILFRRGKLRPEVRTMMVSQKFEELETLLKKADPQDDCSAAILQLS